jgi:truncated hemoglobin YjbI
VISSHTQNTTNCRSHKSHYRRLSSMCKGIQQETFHKENLLDRIGGESQYDYLILSYCENILEDHRLARIYKDYDIDSLASLQKSLLDISFLQDTSGKIFYEDSRNHIVMQNYALFEKGMNVHHFDLLRKHFVDALHNSWIQDELFDLCQHRFEALRSIFEEEGRVIENMLIEQRVVEVCILSARSA